MRKHSRLSLVPRLLVAALVLVSSVSCGGELLRTGRAPVYLTILTLEGGSSGTTSSVVRSDVQVLVDTTIGGRTVQVPTALDDIGVAALRVDQKNTAAVLTPLNSVTITRYHVEYKRADGRNKPGVDVPYGYDGGASVSINPNGVANVTFQLVRQQANLETPLKNLASLGGLGFLSTIAEVTFYGRDGNGNEVSVTGYMDVMFADFGDS